MRHAGGGRGEGAIDKMTPPFSAIFNLQAQSSRRRRHEQIPPVVGYQTPSNANTRCQTKNNERRDVLKQHLLTAAQVNKAKARAEALNANRMIKPDKKLPTKKDIGNLRSFLFGMETFKFSPSFARIAYSWIEMCIKEIGKQI